MGMHVAEMGVRKKPHTANGEKLGKTENGKNPQAREEFRNEGRFASLIKSRHSKGHVWGGIAEKVQGKKKLGRGRRGVPSRQTFKTS